MIKSASALKGASDIKGMSCVLGLPPTRGQKSKSNLKTKIPYSTEFFILGKWKERLERENDLLERRLKANLQKIGALRDRMERFFSEAAAKTEKEKVGLFTGEAGGMKYKKMTLGY